VSKHAKEFAREAEQKVEDKKAIQAKSTPAEVKPQPKKPREDRTAPPKRPSFFGPRARPDDETTDKPGSGNGASGTNGSRGANGRAQPKGSQGGRNRKRRGKKGR
jgi:hypothetical protein